MSLRLGTYNILIPRPDKEEKGHPWRARRQQVIATIEDNFDLIGLQEVDSSPEHGQAAYVAQELQALGWSGYEPEHDLPAPYGDVFHHRLPIYWREELFSLQKAGVFKISGWTPEELALMPILEDRYCTYARLTHRATGVSFLMLNTHFQHGLDRSPLERTIALAKQAESFAKVRKELATASLSTPVFFLGDFNNDSPVLRSLYEEGFNDAQQSALALPRIHWAHNSFHNWEEPRPKEGKHIDHLLWRLPSGFSPLSAQVILSEASDHYPLQLEVEYL